MSPISSFLTDEKKRAKKIREGDRKSFSELYISNFNLMCDFGVSITQDEEVTRELVQDVFLSIWVNRREWQPKGTIRSYLYRAIKNRCLDYLKHKKIEKKWQEIMRNSRSENEATPHDDYARVELESIVQKAVNKLPKKQKMVFLLSRVQGLKYREIAEVMEISEKTVENQMAHALRKLREHVNKIYVIRGKK